MTALSFVAIVAAGLLGLVYLRVLGQRQELDRVSPSDEEAVHDERMGRVEAGAGRAPYDWSVDALDFAEFWADYETKRRLEEYLA